jgi:diguanylate cyclase (GGDEF)-like protein
MGRTFSAILIDMNDFKHINDSFGHSVGDKALEETASLLKSCLRTNDFVSRYGGDEFCIVLNISDQMELEKVVNRIRRKVEEHNALSGELYKIEFSMGYAVYDYQSRMSVEAFQAHIDKLMYTNKRASKAG